LKKYNDFMKTHLLTLLLITLSFNSFGKQASGIYLNFSDYKNDKLTYENTLSKESPKIHIHEFFWNVPTIAVTQNGKKHAYKKSDIYGFKDRNNDVYRFYKNSEYRIIEAAQMYIYVLREHIAQSKGFKVVNRYYFSVTPETDIKPLTLGNLKDAYSKNEKFIDLLDQYFNSENVLEYDTLHKTFKVNYVLSKAINQ